MSLTNAVVQQLQKLIQENVNRHFGPLKPADRTAEKVQAFAQKQLDFFIAGLAKESPELRVKWAKSHPFIIQMTVNKEFGSFEVKIEEKEPGKY